MDELERKQTALLTIKKVFDMKMKTGHVMKKAFIDETDFLKTFYFLKGTKLYMIDITSKKIDECEFTRGKEVLYINGNMNNDSLLVILKNGKIYAIDSNHNIRHFKNLVLNSQLLGVNLDNLKMFSSQRLDKLVIANENFLTIWYRSEGLPINSSKDNLNSTRKNQNALSGIRKSSVEELNGTFYNISLENEKKLIEKTNPNFLYESIAVYFGNNYFLGSFGKIVYASFIPTEISNLFKLVLIDYTFRYDKSHKFKCTDEIISNPSEEDADNYLAPHDYLKNIEKRTLYSTYTYSHDLSKENLQFCKDKDRLITKFNTSGNCLAMMINSHHASNSVLTLFMTETSKFSSYKLFDMWTKVKPPKNEGGKFFIWVEDIDWICGDLFLVLLLSTGYFVILNLDFSIINFIDTSQCTISSSGMNNVASLSCPTYIFNQKLKHSDKLQLITSKKRTDYFAIYNKDYCICFLTNSKNYETKVLSLNGGESFEDFLYLLKYFQIYHNENESGVLFDNIHNYMVRCLKELYNPESEQTMPNEHGGYIFNIFVKFIRIFRSINLVHETNLTILSYLIGVSNDFFYHLINYKEIWLAFLFVEICENYLLKPLRAKMTKNKLDDEMMKSQISYKVFNPYQMQNPSLKCYNKIANKVLHSRLRLILIFFALIEFRNNQALNINVLYFILAKNCIEKLKKNNLLDDIQTLVKIIIRNWKYLKSENARVGGEEYILSGLTMNLKTELLSNFIYTRVSREDIQFGFFCEFLPLESLVDFFDLHESYCKGEDESLVIEYNYINNVGIIQRWILFFTNYFYNYLFEDIKNYTTNHIKQTLQQNKKQENISPEETNLSSLIYFNVTFFLMAMNNHLKYFLKYFNGKYDSTNADDTTLLTNFDKTFMPFVSPVDVPYIIFEFYSVEDNKMRRNLGYEINLHLENLINNYSKNFDFAINDTFDFIEFLMGSGFKHEERNNNMKNNTNNMNNMNNIFSSNSDLNSELNEQGYSDNNISWNSPTNNTANQLQKYIHSAFLFYFFTIHKMNFLHSLETEQNLLISVFDNLSSEFKCQCFSLIYIIANGHLRYFLLKEGKSELSPNMAKYLEILLNFIKVIYYRLLREEYPKCRNNLSDYVAISPNILRPYLLEGALFYEYKNFNTLIKTKLFDNKNVLDINNFLNITNKKLPNLFEDLLGKSQTKLFDTILDTLDTNKQKENNTITPDFKIIVNNLIRLSKSGKKNNFGLESNIDYIRKAIFNVTHEKGQNSNNSNMDFIHSIVDKLIKTNLESNKKEFKFNNNESKYKILKSIKLAYLKTLHLLNLALVKYSSFFCLNPQKETLNYLKLIAYCMLFTEGDKNDVSNVYYILDYITNIKELKEVEKSLIIEIIKMIGIIFIKKGRDIRKDLKFILFENSIKDRAFVDKIKLILKEEITKIGILHENLAFLTSSNLRNCIILCFCDFYWENMLNLFNLIEDYTSKISDIPMYSTRKYYCKLSESFYELTGIPNKSFIEFKSNWSISTDESLNNCIVNDDFEDPTLVDPNCNLIMNRRQRFGNDTPRNKNKNSKLIIEDRNSSCDSNRSVILKEENKVDISVTNLKVLKLKDKSCLPPRSTKIKIDKQKSIATNDENKSVITIIKKGDDQNDNISSNTIISLNKVKKLENNSKKDDLGSNDINTFVNGITQIFYNQFKRGIFQKYKEEMQVTELDEIKIYNIKPKEGSVEVLVLKEKFVANKEIDFKSSRGNNTLNSSYISDMKSIRRKNESVNNTNFAEGEKNPLNIKPFDIININKYRSGQGDKSAIYKDLLNTRNRKEIQSTIKNKIKEIQEKLKVYEEMALNLGKEFSTTFNPHK